MHQPLTRAKALQNQRFLRHLARTGNVDEAARAADVHRSVLYRRRAAHPDFAQRWDAAHATAQARLHASGGRSAAVPTGAEQPLRTAGGEPVVVRAGGGRMQVRRSHPGKLTQAAEQAFLAALSATANVALSAAAAGSTAEAFYNRRKRSPAFAREWRLALQQGYEALEMELLAGWQPESHADDAWRHNDPPAIPPMTAAQALQLLYLHQKAVLDQDEPPHLKRRRGESDEAWSHRLAAMAEVRKARDREAFRVAEAERRTRGEPAWGEDTPVLPDLGQVTGWSRAGEGEVYDPERALFGGWRVGGVGRGRK